MTVLHELDGEFCYHDFCYYEAGVVKHQHCYAHRSSHLLRQGSHNCVHCMGIFEGEGGWWPLILDYAGVGLWIWIGILHWVLQKMIRLLVGLSGEVGGWFWGQSGVGTWTRLEVGVGLNSRGEGIWLTDSKLLIWGMHWATESTRLNWLFTVSRMLSMLSSCVLTCISSDFFILRYRFPWTQVCISGCGYGYMYE